VGKLLFAIQDYIPPCISLSQRLALENGSNLFLEIIGFNQDRPFVLFQ
jgi:hypothetical protein